MTYIIKRQPSTKDGTFGEFLKDGKHLCFTCEDPWNDNKPRESCIPTGTYKVIPHSGPHFVHVWEITNVPHRSAILIHSGNTIDDTLGCILVGGRLGELNNKPAVLGSTDTLNMLRKTLPETFELTII